MRCGASLVHAHGEAATLAVMSIEVSVVRVFTDEQGLYGNPLGIVDAGTVAESDRQALAAELGFSETVFTETVVVGHDGSARVSARIHTPAVELPFAGHPTVGLSWWLRDQGTPIDTLIVPAGDVRVRYDGATARVRARADWAPTFVMHPCSSVDEVEAADPSSATDGHHYFWAWTDRQSGAIRSRMFAPEMGIAEDEATGAAAVRITDELGRGLRIHQGVGSHLVTTRTDDGWIELGGRTVFDRTFTV